MSREREREREGGEYIGGRGRGEGKRRVREGERVSRYRGGSYREAREERGERRGIKIIREELETR